MYNVAFLFSYRLSNRFPVFYLQSRMSTLRTNVQPCLNCTDKPYLVLKNMITHNIILTQYFKEKCTWHWLVYQWRKEKGSLLLTYLFKVSRGSFLSMTPVSGSTVVKIHLQWSRQTMLELQPHLLWLSNKRKSVLPWARHDPFHFRSSNYYLIPSILRKYDIRANWHLNWAYFVLPLSRYTTVQTCTNRHLAKSFLVAW